jgi:C4-dicarboxylate transporter DctQ subunit
MSLDSVPNSHLKQRIFQWGTRTSDLGLGFAAVALLLVVALNGLNVVLRYFFFSALSWAEEVMLYFMIYGVYLGAVSVAWQQAHIRIDTLLNLVPHRWRRPLHIINTIIAAAILLPVVSASYHVVNVLLQLDERSDAVNVPMWIPQGVVPVSLLLIVILSLLRIFVGPPAASDATHDEFDRI